MYFEWNNQKYPIIITRKRNKNTYLRVKEDRSISVTTPYFVTKKQIEEMIYQNQSTIIRMLERSNKRTVEQQTFSYLGKKYDIIVQEGSTFEINEDVIITPDLKYLEKWYLKEMKKLYHSRVDYWYYEFDETIPYPILKIRKMKTRWGVCNRKNNSVTLNSELFRFDLSKIDYVIIHELSHFIEFNHSPEFWEIVHRYCPNYKKIRKEMKE